MPSRRTFLSSASAASAALAGCPRPFNDIFSRYVPPDWTPGPGEWAGPGYDQANSNHNPHASPPETEPTEAWDVESSRPSVVVAEETVFLREAESLRALNAEDGSEQFEVSRPPGWGVRYVDGRLYDLTPDRLDPDATESRLSKLHGLTLDGETVWDDPVRHTDQITSFVEREGYVYVTTGKESLHHHDIETSERVDATVHDVAVLQLANHDGVLYAMLADGVVAYDVTDEGSLEERWRHRFNEKSDFEPVNFAIGGGRAALVLNQKESRGIRVLMFDIGGGEFLGPIEFERSATRIVMGEYSYINTIRTASSRPTAGEIRAYDGTDEHWTVDLEFPPFWLALAGQTLIVGGNDGLTVAAIDGESGDKLWTYEGAFPNAVVDEAIYATTRDDQFVALRE